MATSASAAPSKGSASGSTAPPSPAPGRNRWRRSPGPATCGVHGDLLPGNLLVNHGRLSAVIDWGALNAGDPACDLQPAWNIFTGHSRKLFLSEHTTAVSLLDNRILHHANVVITDGDSYRMRQARARKGTTL